jgi:hypothetical protein
LAEKLDFIDEALFSFRSTFLFTRFPCVFKKIAFKNLNRGAITMTVLALPDHAVAAFAKAGDKRPFT